MRRVLQQTCIGLGWLGVLWILWAPGFGSVSHGSSRNPRAVSARYDGYGFTEWFSVSSGPDGYQESIRADGIAIGVVMSLVATAFAVKLLREDNPKNGGRRSVL